MKHPVDAARNLRKNQTDAEKKLWDRLRNRQLGDLKFRRQHPVPPYTVDFFCEKNGLIVEIDGGQHTPEKDENRTRFLEDKGHRVIRFWNNEVLGNIEGVLQSILMEKDKVPSPASRSAQSTLSPREREAGAKPDQGEGKKKRVCLGKIATAHGVRGLVKLTVYADDPASLEDYGPLYTSQSGDKTIKLSLHNPMGKFWLAAVEGITDRTQAETLRNTELWLDREHLPAAEEGQYYHADLIGLAVQDEQGGTIGKIIAVDNFGAGDLLDIKPPSGPSFYLPFTQENVPGIDLDKGIAVAVLPPGIV